MTTKERTALIALQKALRNCPPRALQAVNDALSFVVSADGEYAEISDAFVDSVAEALDPPAYGQ